jgi:hypothetical protein
MNTYREHTEPHIDSERRPDQATIDAVYSAAFPETARIEREQAGQREQQPPDLSSVPTGRYAYQPPDNQAQFYHIDNLKLEPNPNNPKWDGWIFVKAEYGGRTPEKAGAQRPGAPHYTGPRTPAMIAIAANPQAACSLYGKLIGKCGICGRTLTNEESRTTGIGPICASKVGW